jgi:hypothetical protein
MHTRIHLLTPIFLLTLDSFVLDYSALAVNIIVLPVDATCNTA